MIFLLIRDALYQDRTNNCYVYINVLSSSSQIAIDKIWMMQNGQFVRCTYINTCKDTVVFHCDM